VEAGPAVGRLLGADGVAAALAAARRGMTCAVCDGGFDSAGGGPVVGVRLDGPPGRGAHRALPTHAACGAGRVWAPGQLDAERVRRGRAPEGGPAVADDRPRGPDRLEPVMSGPPGDELAAVLFHPGAPYPHGLLGHLADRLSEGLPPLDLTGAAAAEDLPGWTVHVSRGRVAAISLGRGAGVWWASPGGCATFRDWRRAAQERRRVLLGVLPPDEEPAGSSDTTVLGRAIREGLVLGGVAALSGSVL
jgi:hypothetical protein